MRGFEFTLFFFFCRRLLSTLFLCESLLDKLHFLGFRKKSLESSTALVTSESDKEQPDYYLCIYSLACHYLMLLQENRYLHFFQVYSFLRPKQKFYTSQASSKGV